MSCPDNTDNNTGPLQTAWADELFRKLYEEKWPLLYLFTARLVQDEEVAKDIVQDTFVKCYNKMDRFSSQSDALAYLYVSCRNSGYDYLRYEKLQNNKLDINKIDSIKSNMVPLEEDKNALTEIIANEFIAEIYQEIENLPEQRKQVLKMLFSDGFTLSEVAEQLDITYEHAKSTKHQAIAQLRKLLKTAMLLLLFYLL